MNNQYHNQFINTLPLPRFFDVSALRMAFNATFQGRIVPAAASKGDVATPRGIDYCFETTSSII